MRVCTSIHAYGRKEKMYSEGGEILLTQIPKCSGCQCNIHLRVPNQPFPLSNKICRGVQWRPSTLARPITLLSFFSTYVCLFLSLSFYTFLSLCTISLCLSLAGSIPSPSPSRNSHIPTRKASVDLFAAFNWPISLESS